VNILADSGTSYILIPFSAYTKVLKNLNSKGHGCALLKNPLKTIECDCNKDTIEEDFPKIEFEIGSADGSNNTIYTIPGDSYVVASGVAGKCILRIMEMNVYGPNTWILGINFFQNYYSVFD